ncbi:MAG: AMP-binding protein [Clostridia bacterium]|nr:AMP-binding protein [Clostridia bacterium]
MDTKQKRIDMFKNAFESEYTWLNGFMRNVDRFGNREALFNPVTNTRWSYKALNEDANRFSNAILDAGIKKGDVVMFQLLNCPEFVFAYIACHKTGAVSCPVNFRLSAGELAQTIDDSKPMLFIYESINKEAVAHALTMCRHKPKIVIMIDDEEGGKPLDGTVSYTDFVKYQSAENPVLHWGLSIYDETTRLYTSGTTGNAKGVCLTSINEVLSAHDVMIHFPFSSDDKSMNTTPWFHRGGLHSGGITPTLYAGGSVTIMRKFDPVETLRYIEQYKLSFIIGVPNVLERLTEAQEKNGFDLSALRGIVTMGSPLERAACIRYQSVLTPKIFNGYGTTESFWNTFLRPSDLPAMAGTAGSSCTDDDVRIVKVFEDRRAEPDELAARDGKEVGEIIIKSYAKSSYVYYNNEAETERKFHDGYLYTGDLGTWDKNYFISVAGRKDDMIISGGENIYPAQVEEVLNTHPKVADSIVTAVPDKVRGEIVTAYIVKADDSLTVGELEDFCKDSPMIANYKRPRYYRFVASVPVNATGKKLHYKMKELAKDDLINGLLIRV